MTAPDSRQGPKPAFWNATRVSYLSFALMAFGFVFSAGGRLPYTTAAVAALLPLFSLVYAFLLSRNVKVHHSLSAAASPRGSELRYHIKAHNKSILVSPYICITPHCEHILTAVIQQDALFPLGEASWDLVLRPKHRGEYHFEIENAKTADLFNLLRLRCHKPEPLTFLSLPIVSDPPPALRERLSEAVFRETFMQNSDEVAVDARAYRPGDSVRRIHWNLTARSRELMVRRFEGQGKQRVICLLDLRPGSVSLACEDALIECCLSVLYFLLKKTVPCTLVYAERDEARRMTGESVNAFRPMYEALARVPLEASLPVCSLFPPRGEGSHYMLFSIGVTDETLLRSLPADCQADICEIDDGSAPPPRQETAKMRFYRFQTEAET